MVWDYFQEYIGLLDQRRQERFDALGSAEDVDALRADVRAKLAQMWGPFPTEETPLNARSLGEIDRDDYVIEKVIFDSRPQFPVTANLYRPARVDGKLPAVAVTCGHADEGKAYEDYQRFCILLARSGFVVLIWDPVGQGERLQFWEASTQASALGPGTPEHRVLGNQAYLVGSNLMQYRAWDARRAIDYLQQRPEVDPERIAMGGNSGGGMETLQYAAYDDRVQAAFTSCAVASFPAKTQALLIADPEQILYGTLRHGVDHTELLASLAPKPLLVGSALRDFVPIRAARRTFDETLRAYRLYDASDRAKLAETDDTHGLNQELREAGADWLSRWLSATSQETRETEAVLSTPAELQCTANGQVASDLGAKTVADFNRELAGARATAVSPPADQSRFSVFKADIQRRIKKVTRVGSFRPERGIVVPDRVFDAGSFARGVVVVVSDKGKDDPFLRRAVIDAILSARFGVVALDLRGWGETEPYFEQVRVNFKWDDFFAYRALEIGKPLLGQRMKDLLAFAPRYAQRRQWWLAGVGAGALVAAHAAALDPRVQGLIAVDSILSYRSLVDDPVTVHPVSSFLPGVAREYDVGDVYAALAPRPVLALNPRDPKGRSVHEVQAWEEYDWVAQTYEAVGAPEGFDVKSQLDSVGVRHAITGLLST